MENNLGNKETMARNIRYYMDLNRVTAVDMCKVLGVSQSAFSFWLNAKTYPRIDKIEMMAKYFGVSKADLVEERKQSTSSELRDRFLRAFDQMDPQLQELFAAQAEAALAARQSQDTHQEP